MIDGKPQPMYIIIAQALFSGECFLKTGDANKDCSEKLMAYNLCSRLMSENGNVDITSEEAVLIKTAISNLTPGCFAQIVKAIEG